MKDHANVSNTKSKKLLPGQLERSGPEEDAMLASTLLVGHCYHGSQMMLGTICEQTTVEMTRHYAGSNFVPISGQKLMAMTPTEPLPTRQGNNIRCQTRNGV